ncbi:cytochrome c peroxidase [Mariniblastus fucicola]|nr:cytochrome c peroxidase [Mariniblastus fucicola]
MALATVAAFTLMTVCLVAGTIDLTSLFDYENQTVPAYIQQDNTPPGNAIDNATATLGRVLFYDKNLSSDNTVSCASCHRQEFAFSELAVVSSGVNGVTGRHSMRLINSRFSDERRFFWDERADSLEEQVTQPIQDHAEMGFSGTNGDPDFDDLIVKLNATSYYKSLFTMAFGDSAITEARMQDAMAQFIRSIQSFDSKFDAGLTATNGNINAPFPNFSEEENLGKQLFLQAPQFQNPPPGQPRTGIRVGGGLGCAACHRGAEFAIDPQQGAQRNNGVIGVAFEPGSVDLTNSRSPTLRDILSPEGFANGPLMHDGSMSSIDDVLDHYNDITRDDTVNPNLDPRLHGGPNGPGQKLMMTQQERDAVTAFLKTLSGNDVYTNERWSDPFDGDGSLGLIGNVTFDPVEINDANEQRSNVETVTVRFNGDVTIEPGAISILQRSTKTAESNESVTISVDEQFSGGQTVATIQFDSHTRNANGSLEDGNYQLSIAGHLVLRDGIPMGEDYTFGNVEADAFYTHYGDVTGDRTVNIFDLLSFRQVYGSVDGDVNYDVNLDYDAGGAVNVFDLLPFRQRYGSTLPFEFASGKRALVSDGSGDAKPVKTSGGVARGK